jgi:GMP synthase-like glutamine amidotransferase
MTEFAMLTALLDDLPRVPLLAICFGFHYLTLAAGGSLRRLSDHRNEPAWPIRRVRRDAIFAGLRGLRVVENHQCCVARVAPGYRVVVRSPDGMEAARHRRLPRIGVQFHPEYYGRPSATTDGQRILADWLAGLARR